MGKVKNRRRNRNQNDGNDDKKEHFVVNFDDPVMNIWQLYLKARRLCNKHIIFFICKVVKLFGAVA
jgi:hypothetical protein